MIILIFFVLFGFVLFFAERFQRKREKREIIRLLVNMLKGKENEYRCYEDSENSRISFLLNRIELKNQFLEENAFREKEGIKYMISNLSHQLKTPLASIKLYETLLEEKNVSEEKRMEFQEKMCRQIEKTEWILGSIIKCARLEEGAIEFEPSMQPIQKTLIQAIDAVSLKAAGKNIEIAANHEIENLLLYHNQKWTAEVFINVFENAIKYSPINSTIEIDMEKQESYTKISVTDHGIGIQKKEYAKIFQRFYRSKDVENEDGSGIGLYLCRLILEKEKGNITVKSEYGKGSSFQIYLLNSKP